MKELAAARSLKLTTVGRRSGRPHTVRLWFVPHEGRIFLSTDDCQARDWCRNIRREPSVTLTPGGRTYRGRARLVDDPRLRDELVRLRRERYRGAFMGMAKDFFEITLEGGP
jgi:deazaflavin-dependent oxidoreductase (nitroreductase family)